MVTPIGGVTDSSGLGFGSFGMQSHSDFIRGTSLLVAMGAELGQNKEAIQVSLERLKKAIAELK